MPSITTISTVEMITRFKDCCYLMLNISKIAELRKQKGWDQQTLAKEAGIDPSLISRLERGLQEDFKLSVIIALSKALGVSIDMLLEVQHQVIEPILDPELIAIINLIGQKPQRIHLQAAAILRGYLSFVE